MKKFEDICRMTQAEVKEYMTQYLISKNYDPICEDGFLYAKGDVPVLLVAHMDTVHTKVCEEIITLNGVMSSPQGIGGDDRCGIFMIANIVKDLHCSVLLCEDEEIGMVGAKKFAKTDYIKNLDVNYMVELDRKGVEDAVFYTCANEDFIKFVCNATGNIKAYGSFSDISALMPASKLCGVNLSCGYFNAHTNKEYVDYSVMMESIIVTKHLIQTECDKPFEYKAYEYNDYGCNYDDDYDWYNGWGKDDWDETANNNKKQSDVQKIKYIPSRIAKDTHLELEALMYDASGREKVVYALGETKMECWFELFTNNPEVCMNDIIDYSFM
jgi:hypothetical protein